MLFFLSDNAELMRNYAIQRADWRNFMREYGYLLDNYGC